MIMTGTLAGMIAKLTEGKRTCLCPPLKSIIRMNNQPINRHILLELPRTIFLRLHQKVIGHINKLLQLDLTMEQQPVKRG